MESGDGKTDDPGFCRYAAETMLPLLHQLEQEMSGVRSGDDIEYVHRSRVASRRIRASLQIFSSCLPVKSSVAWRRRIRDVTRALGEARDLDVQTGFIERYLREQTEGSGDPVLFFTDDLPLNPESLLQVLSAPYSSRPGLECIRLRLIQHRLQIQPAVLKAVDRLESSEVIESMMTCFHELKVRAFLAAPDIRTRYAYQQAFYHIMTCIQDLFWYEPWLSDPLMIKRHHEMRIAAKHLRYTLEAFSGLYEDNLKGEIKTFKSLQDLLGDMHDCDVWIAAIPGYLQDEKQRSISYFGNDALFRVLEPGLSDLLANRREIRSRLFSDLHDLWFSLKQDGFWKRLEEKISTPVCHSFVPEMSAGDEDQVRIALISDVHGNLPALEAVLEDAREKGVTAVLNAGDSVGYGAFPDEVVTLLRSSGVLSVIGNYDQSVLVKKWKSGRPRSRDKHIAMRYAYRNLSGKNRRYLKNLPTKIRLRVRNRTLLVTHGSPDSITEYLVPETPQSRFSEIAASAGADIVVTGHAHLPSVHETDGVWFVNCGSVGRTEDGDPRACYALLTLEPFSIVHIRIPYDIERAVVALRNRHLPDSFVRIVSEGRSLDLVSHPGGDA